MPFIGDYSLLYLAQYKYASDHFGILAEMKGLTDNNVFSIWYELRLLHTPLIEDIIRQTIGRYTVGKLARFIRMLLFHLYIFLPFLIR